MRSLAKKADLAFIKSFKEKVFAYIDTFREAEALDKALRDRFYPRRTTSDEDVANFGKRFVEERSDLIAMYDRVRAIYKKYGVSESFHQLISRQPGDTSEWGYKMTLPESYELQLNDSLVRISSAIENTPSFWREVLTYCRHGWKWVDQRGVAKWIVVSALALVCLALMRAMGYDLNGLIRLVKAIRGEK